MNRRTFLKATASTGTFFWAAPLLSASQPPPGPSDDELLKKADERIEACRKGDLNIRLQDAQGRPVPGARVALEQTRHAFLFGCNFFMFDRCGDPDAEALYRERFAKIFNYATLGFYWASYEPEQGKPSYEYTDRVLEWTGKQGIICKGHPLVWDHPAGSPRWLPDDNAQLERLSAGRVREIVTRFAGRLDMWDVVNEATHLPDKVNNTRMAKWAASLGPVPYVVNHLKIARAANEKAKLVVNDYRLEPAYFRILEQVRSQGKDLFDIVGIQSHMHGEVWPLKKAWEICDRYTKLGLPLHFTETTIVSGPRKGPGENWGETTPEGEDAQAAATEKLYRLLFSHPAVQALTWWDFSDRGAWQRAAAGFVRKDMSPKPVYERLQPLIRKTWWTKDQATADANGQWKARAFFGDYKIGIQLPGGKAVEKQIEFNAGGKSDFTFNV